ncbi:MAG: hypothetical protein H7248_08425, partial [Microbacteriaceae bacterium]|nr:hypothetical protein [Microbacteriaceae bacterium]
DTLFHPLTTDVLIEQRVAALVGRAYRRQLWFFFVDRERRQRPLLIPFSDPPNHPDDSVPDLARVMKHALHTQEAESLIIVLERYADAVFSAGDKAWARRLTREFAALQVPVLGFLVSHRRGVRWLTKDDYEFETVVT